MNFTLTETPTTTSDEPLLFPQLRFTLSYMEYTRARRTFSSLNAARMLTNFAVAFVAIVLVGLLLLNFLPPDSGSNIGLFFATIFAVQLVIFSIQNRWAWRKVPHLHGHQTVEITDSRLRFIKADSAATLGW